MSEPCVLAFDLGTSGLKAAVVASSGALVDSAVVPLGVSLLPGGGAEQQPLDWWAAMVTATGRLFAGGKARAAQVVAIGVSSQWGGTVATDREGTPLRPAIIWMDSRGSEDVRALAGGFPPIEGYGALKIQAWIRKTALTAHHPCGTCPMGTGPDSVLDPELKVRGVDGLRVVDASVMPDIVSAHINACVLMLAEKASDMIRGMAPLPAEGA